MEIKFKKSSELPSKIVYESVGNFQNYHGFEYSLIRIIKTQDGWQVFAFNRGSTRGKDVGVYPTLSFAKDIVNRDYSVI